MIKLSKADRELLTLMADETNPYGMVFYVPGREREIGAPTRYSFQRYQPAKYGMKSFVRVTAPVGRLIEACLVQDVTGDERQQVHVTAAGRAWLAAWEATHAARA